MVRPKHTAPQSLRDQYPNLEKFWPFMEMFKAESERGAVLMAAGFIEEQLKEILLAFMLNSKVAKSLLDAGGSAPLGSLASRASCAYALGLITENELHDLTLIRKIRNEFAHNVDVGFDTDGVIERCAQLRLKAPVYDNVKLDARAEFNTSALALILNFVNRPHYVSSEKRQTKSWPY